MQVYLELAPLVDVLSCPAEGLRFFYGIEGDDPAPAALERFDLQAVLMTTRTELGMWRNRVGATVVARGQGGAVETHQDGEREVEIVDRLGAGDAFLAGFLYGLLTLPDGAPAPAGSAPDWARATAFGGACARVEAQHQGGLPHPHRRGGAAGDRGPRPAHPALASPGGRPPAGAGAEPERLDPALAPEREPQGAVERQGQQDGPQVGHRPA